MYLLTGGSGFIGINFAKFLVENDYNFKIYDKKKSEYLPKNIDIILGDIRDKNKLSQAMDGCEIVFHLATGPPSLKLSNQEIYDIDVNGTKNVLTAAEKNNVERIIFTSSASHVYGIVDKDLCPIQENCSLNPINEYGKNKLLAEDLCKKLQIPFHIINTSREYGLSIDKINQLISVLKEKKRSFERNPMKGECSYCGTIKRYSINKFASEAYFTTVVTGHNLSDESTQLMNNFFNVNLNLMAHSGPIINSKIKKFYFKL